MACGGAEKNIVSGRGTSGNCSDAGAALKQRFWLQPSHSIANSPEHRKRPSRETHVLQLFVNVGSDIGFFLRLLFVLGENVSEQFTPLNLNVRVFHGRSSLYSNIKPCSAIVSEGSNQVGSGRGLGEGCDRWRRG